MAWTNDCMTTQRLRLRAATDQDKKVLAKLLQDPEVRQYLGGPISDEDLATFQDSTVGEHWGSFVIADGAMDLCMGAVSFTNDRGEWEISYQLLPRYWGRGFAVEGVTAAIEWAWEEPTLSDCDSLIAVSQKTNSASIKMLERIGFVFDRQFSEHGALQSQYRLPRDS